MCILPCSPDTRVGNCVNTVIHCAVHWKSAIFWTRVDFFSKELWFALSRSSILPWVVARSKMWDILRNRGCTNQPSRKQRSIHNKHLWRRDGVIVDPRCVGVGGSRPHTPLPPLYNPPPGGTERCGQCWAHAGDKHKQRWKSIIQKPQYKLGKHHFLRDQATKRERGAWAGGRAVTLGGKTGGCGGGGPAGGSAPLRTEETDGTWLRRDLHSLPPDSFGRAADPSQVLRYVSQKWWTWKVQKKRNHIFVGRGRERERGAFVLSQLMQKKIGGT